MISAFEGIISTKTSRDSVVRSVDHVATTIEMGKQIVAMSSKLILLGVMITVILSRLVLAKEWTWAWILHLREDSEEGHQMQSVSAGASMRSV